MTQHTLPKPGFAGLINKPRLFLSILFISSIVSTLTYFILKDSLNTTTEHQARVIAEIVALQAAAGRTVYSKYVVSKLKHDGLGAHIDSSEHHGLVPLPAQFLKLMGREASKSNAALFRYKPISKWHLEASQGLNDDFENWAWEQLQAQDQANPTGPIDWQPAWWTEVWKGERYFRYMRADPAANQSCVDCHNAYLRKETIKAQLKADGILQPKQWKMHQLLGGISVTIPLAKIERIAIGELRQTIVWTSTILVTALIIIGGIIISNTHPNTDKQDLAWDETHEQDTGLLSLTGLEHRLSSAVECARPGERNHSFICLKFNDHFDTVQAHADLFQTLRVKFSAKIKLSLRQNDSLGWLSHEKLGILVLDCGSDHAKIIITQLRKSLQETATSLDNIAFSINTTITLSLITKDTLSVSSIIKTTDRFDHEIISAHS